MARAKSKSKIISIQRALDRKLTVALKHQQLRKLTYRSRTCYSLFKRRNEVSIPKDEIEDIVRVDAEEVGDVLGPKASSWISRCLDELEYHKYLVNTDGQYELSDGMVTLLNLIRDQIQGITFASEKERMYSICLLFLNRMQSRRTLPSKDALMTELNAVYRELETLKTAQQQQTTAANPQEDVVLNPVTPVRRKPSMNAYPTPESLPRPTGLQRAPSTHENPSSPIASTSNNYPFVEDDDAMDVINDEEEVANMLRREVSDLTAKLADSDARLADSNTRLADSEQQRRVLQEQYAELERKIHEHTTLYAQATAECAQLQEQVRQCNDDQADVQRRYYELLREHEESTEKTSRLEDNLLRLQRRKEDLERDESRLLEQISALWAHYSTHLDQRRDEIEAVEQRIYQLQQRCEDSELHISELQHRCEDFERLNAELEDRCARIVQERDAAMEQLAALGQRNTSLEKQLTECQRDKEALETRYEESLRDRNGLQETVERLAAPLRAYAEVEAAERQWRSRLLDQLPTLNQYLPS